MRISDWSSDVCSSDLKRGPCPVALGGPVGAGPRQEQKGVQHFREIAFPAACRARKYDYYDHKDIFARIDGMSASNWKVAEAKARDRKGVVTGRSGSVRVDLGGGQIIKKKMNRK